METEVCQFPACAVADNGKFYMTQQAVIHAGVLHFLEEQAHTIGAGEYQPGVCSQVSVGFLHGRAFCMGYHFHLQDW